MLIGDSKTPFWLRSPMIQPRGWSFSLLTVAVFTLPACSKKAVSPQLESRKQAEITSVAAKLNVCTMLTNDEIQAVQGSPVLSSTPSTDTGGTVQVSLCYFATAQSNKSVSLSVTQSKPGNQSVRDYWNQTFGRFRNEEKKEEDKETVRAGERKEREEGE